MRNYFFEDVTQCEMCGAPTNGHKVLGQRLNKSQGLNPRKRNGISISIKRCGRCDLIYPSPLPIPNDIQDHYGTPPEDYWYPDYFTWNPEYFSEQIASAKRLLSFVEGMKALDIGAGLGKAMLSMQNAGFDTYGFEPSIPFYERALEKMKIPKEKLKLGMIESAEYDPETFDFISFGAVFEHLYHPSSSLEKALTWLKRGGIVHIEVPSSKYLIARLINFYYSLIGTNYVTHLSPMHPPFHIYEFGLKSFQFLAPKLNYQIVDSRFDVANIELLPGIFHPLLKKYMQFTNTGMQLTVYLRKN